MKDRSKIAFGNALKCVGNAHGRPMVNTILETGGQK